MSVATLSFLLNVRATRWTALGAAVVAGILVALPYWCGQVDDVFITVGFARHWLETGTLAWTSGEVVEGYSSPAWVVASLVPLVLRLDPGVFLQCLSSVGAVLLLTLASRPWSRSLWGVALLIVVACQDPIVYWAANGMEVLWFALLLALGWGALADMRVSAWRIVVPLALASLTRPEGVFHFAAAVVVALIRERRSITRPAVVGVLLLAAYHLVRVHHFGAWLPTSVLVKAVAHHDLIRGLTQATMDLAPWMGVAIVLGSIFAVHRGKWFVALVPVSIQAAALVKAGGDWMGHGRLVVPGVVGALAVLTAGAERRPVRAAVAAIGLTGALSGTILQSPQGDPTNLQLKDFEQVASAWNGWGFVLRTPFVEDLEFLIPRIPDGNAVSTGDVGLVGQIPGVVVVDQVGLVSRDVALGRAFQDEEALARADALFDGSSDSVLCIRIARPLGLPIGPLPGEMAKSYAHCEDVDSEFRLTRYCCRERLEAQPERAVGRWAALATLFPSQPDIQLCYARALADAGGEMQSVEQVLAGVRAWGDSPAWAAMGLHAVDFVSGPGQLDPIPGRGFALWSNGAMTSRALDDISSAKLEMSGDLANGVGPTAVIRAFPPCLVDALKVTDIRYREVSLDALGCAPGERRRIRVEFTNDLVTPDGDRNLYVRIVDPTTKSLR